jgi:DNA repair protein RadC
MQTSSPRLRELTVRYAIRRDIDGQPVTLGPSLTCPMDCAQLLRRILEDEPAEVFGILCLTTKHRVIAYHEVSRGQLDASIVHPREVFKAAILANAAAIVMAHNHPSGDPTPSSDDFQLTRRLIDAGLILGIPVLDHIVIGDGVHISLLKSGHITSTARPDASLAIVACSTEQAIVR